MNAQINTEKSTNKVSNILVVDDDPTTRHVVRAMISKLNPTWPLKIIDAINGHQALEIISSTQIDVVVSDLVMPKMSGLMLLHSMLERGVQIPFILITGFSDKDSAIQALRLGVFDYLEKPIHETDLIPVVQEALRVSQDQRRLLNGGGGTSDNSSIQRLDPRTKVLILKMKTFAKGDESKDYFSIPKGNSWVDYRNMFVTESSSLIEFAIASLDSIHQSKRVILELGFVLRVIQSLRFAAESLNLGHIVDFSWRCEMAIASLKLVAGQVTEGNIDIVKNCLKLLDKKVKDLVDPEEIEAQTNLDSILQNLRNVG